MGGSCAPGSSRSKEQGMAAVPRGMRRLGCAGPAVGGRAPPRRRGQRRRATTAWPCGRARRRHCACCRARRGATGVPAARAAYCSRALLLPLVPPHRECARLAGELDVAGVQARVLLETLETLQAGGDSEREQRVVALTAQVAAATARGAAQEARVRELLVRGCLLLSVATAHERRAPRRHRHTVPQRLGPRPRPPLQDECEARGAAAAQLRAALEAEQLEGAARAAAAAVAEDAAAAAARRAEELRSQVRAASQQVAASGRALSQLQQRLATAEAEVDGLRAALEDAATRHAAQLQE